LLGSVETYFNPVSTLSSQLSAYYHFASSPSYDVDTGFIQNFAYPPATGPFSRFW
jgi:hypothetical protein